MVWENILVYAKKGIYWVNCEEDDELLNNLKGCHSGFSKDEIYVPFIIIRNDRVI